MQSSERSWSDRNGADHEWGGGSGPGSSVLGTSPRKDFGRGFDSWRRQGRTTVSAEQDDEPPAPGGWRSSTTKWSGRTGGSSWRSDSEPNKDASGWSVPRSNSNSWGEDHASSRGPHPHVHRPWDPPHAHSHPASHGADGDSVSGPLPEWATETPTESRGSFDASGAFHGGTPLSDDEDGGGGHGAVRGQRHSALAGDPGKRSGSPLTQRDAVPPGVTRSASQNGIGDPAERHVRPVQEVTKSASTGSDSPRRVTTRSTDRTEETESRRTVVEKQTPPPPPAPSIAPSDRGREREREGSASRPDEEMERMREVADDLVAKLMEDEDHRTPTGVPPPAPAVASDKWYYRDPQGDVQGPFSSSEMLDWFRSGYFNLTLLVRRACDERYSSLGDIIKLWGRLPFTPGGPPVPPIKADAIPPASSVSVPPLVPAAPPPASDILSDSHGHSHSLLMQQYQYQYSMLQRQLLLGQQAAVHAAAQAAIGELSQSDRWATLSPIEQRRLVTERLALQQMLGVPPLVPPVSVSVPPPSIVDLFSVAAAQQQPAQQPPPPGPAAQPQTNPVAQLISQMQMAAAVGPKEQQAPPPGPHGLVDPLQQLIQQMGGVGGLPAVSSAPSVPPPGGPPLGGGVGLDSDGPGRTLLQTLNAGKPAAIPPVDSVWGGSVPAGYSLGVGTAAPWMTTMTPAPAVAPTVSSAPPGQLPSLPLSLWDLAQQQGKDVKTEHQVLEEQLRAEEERRLEEQRKREENEEAMRKQKELLEKEEEEKRKLKEEEEKKKKKRQEEEEEKKKRKQLEEEDKKKKKQQEEEERRRKKQQEEEKRRKKEEEEERRRRREQEEAERQLREEEERERKKKQQEAKKIEEAMKKEKEKAAQKREEEKKRKEAEKEKKKKAEEAKKKEEEEKKKQEEEERARQRRQEQQEKALRKLQEQQEKARQAAALRPAPWTATAPVQQPLTEIQRQERERERQQQLLLQQQQQQQQQQQNAIAAAQNSAGTQAGNGSSVRGGLQLRWAEVKPAVPVAKSLTEIQQEEQENLAKQQLERERQQQQQQQAAVAAPAVATASIWGGASQSLSWAASVSAASPWGNAGVTANSTSSGFWEDAAKTATAVPISKSRSATNHNNNIINSGSSGNNKNAAQPWKNVSANTKTRSKKEEAVVMKLFEPRPDEFTQWCTDALGSLKHSIDVPTFVTFLRDIESAYEVKDYVRVYLGEGRDAQEFSRQFLERRSKLQQQKQRAAHAPEDDLSTPAPAITPSQDFHEVKGKGKKAKKSRMYKVDSRILGFSVTAAQDRLNVGERDFGDGM